VAALCQQSFAGTPPERCEDNEVLEAYRSVREEWREAMDTLGFHRALECVWRYLSMINGYVVSREPWKIRKEEGASARLSRVLYAAAEGIRVAAAMLSPFVPATSRKIFATFGAPARDPVSSDLEWGGIRPGMAMPKVEPLFPRADAGAYLKPDSKEEGSTMNDVPVPPRGPAAPPVETTQAVSPSENRIGIDEFQKVRLVTGKVLTAERVPRSNKLIQMQVDLGTERRQIVAGIAGKYEPEALLGRNVVIVANLKPAKLMGVESNGMVLAATVGEAGEPVLLEVPEQVPPGSRVK
jgi:methionyl-tRNA synthetase